MATVDIAGPFKIKSEPYIIDTAAFVEGKRRAWLVATVLALTVAGGTLLIAHRKQANQC